MPVESRTHQPEKSEITAQELVRLLRGLIEEAKAGRERLKSVPEIAEYLQVSRGTIYRLVNEGRIPHYKIGSAVRFDVNKVKKWLEKAEVRGRLTRRIPV